MFNVVWLEVVIFILFMLNYLKCFATILADEFCAKDLVKWLKLFFVSDFWWCCRGGGYRILTVFQDIFRTTSHPLDLVFILIWYTKSAHDFCLEFLIIFFFLYAFKFSVVILFSFLIFLNLLCVFWLISCNQFWTMTWLFLGRIHFGVFTCAILRNVFVKCFICSSLIKFVVSLDLKVFFGIHPSWNCGGSNGVIYYRMSVLHFFNMIRKWSLPYVLGFTNSIPCIFWCLGSLIQWLKMFLLHDVSRSWFCH